MSKLTLNQQIFLEFIREREAARVAKDHGIHPHSDDPIIADYKFCNINREHDRVTVWVADNVRKSPKMNKSLDCLVMHLAIARVFNHPPTLEAILPMRSWKEAASILEGLKAKQKIFRGAYKMPAHGKGGSGGSSHEYFLRGLRQIAEMRFDDCKTLEDIATRIQKARGFGPFLANQIVTDLRYTPYGATAPDWESFVLCGPGTKKGLCVFFDEKPRKGGSQAKAQIQLREARQILAPHLEDPFPDYYKDPNNFTNSFCEFFKYFRCLKGGTPPKVKYQPHTDK